MLILEKFLNTLKSLCCFKTSLLYLSSFEIQKIAASPHFWKRYFSFLFIKYSLRLHGFAVTVKRTGDIFLLYKTKIPDPLQQASKLCIVEDLYFHAIHSFYPLPPHKWVLLLMPAESDKLSLSLFLNGFLYYKRTLFQDSNREEEIIASLKYIKKFGYNGEEVEGLWLTETKTDPPSLPFLHFKSLHISIHDLLTLGLTQRDKITLKSPLTGSYGLKVLEHFSHRSLVFFTIPLLMVTLAAFLAQDHIYPPGALAPYQEEIESLEKKLYPKEIANLAHQKLFPYKEFLQKFVKHLPLTALPDHVALDFKKREAQFRFAHIKQLPKTMKPVIPGYTFTRTGEIMMMKESHS